MNMSMKGLTFVFRSEATGMYRISLTDWWSEKAMLSSLPLIKMAGSNVKGAKITPKEQRNKVSGVSIRVNRIPKFLRILLVKKRLRKIEKINNPAKKRPKKACISSFG
jgi:hypothetical protein